MIKKSLFYLIGIFTACFGVSVVIKSDIGAAPWDAFFVGVVENFGLSIGVWVAIAQVFFLIINSLLLKKRPKYESAITIIIWSLVIDLHMEVIFKNVNLADENIYIKVTAFITGLIILSLGLSTYITSSLPTMPYDGTMLAISERFKLKLNITRTILEGAGLISALLVAGPIGFGTVVIWLLVGPFIQICKRFSDRLYQKI